MAGLLGSSRSLPSASTSYQRPPLRRRLTKVSFFLSLGCFPRRDDVDDIGVSLRVHNERDLSGGVADSAPTLFTRLAVELVEASFVEEHLLGPLEANALLAEDLCRFLAAYAKMYGNPV